MGGRAALLRPRGRQRRADVRDNGRGACSPWMAIASRRCRGFPPTRKPSQPPASSAGRTSFGTAARNSIELHATRRGGSLCSGRGRPNGMLKVSSFTLPPRSRPVMASRIPARKRVACASAGLSLPPVCLRPRGGPVAFHRSVGRSDDHAVELLGCAPVATHAATLLVLRSRSLQRSGRPLRRRSATDAQSGASTSAPPTMSDHAGVSRHIDDSEHNQSECRERVANSSWWPPASARCRQVVGRKRACHGPRLTVLTAATARRARSRPGVRCPVPA
jgi:hypothetical protein